jgi:hypothetical protein
MPLATCSSWARTLRADARRGPGRRRDLRRRTGRFVPDVDLAIADGAMRTAVLMQPNGYIVWAGEHSDPDGHATAIRAALDRYCGSAADQFDDRRVS